MVDAVTSNTSSSIASAIGASQKTLADDAATADSDFDDFLTLLTAQLRNQDPLQPLDSTQFVEQLASFSSVEQQVGMNSRLDRLIGQGSGSEIAALASWIGREAEASQVFHRFDGGRLEVEPPAEPNAESAAMAVIDAEGNEIARVAFDPGADTVAWTGETADALRADAGLYALRFHYEATGREPWSRDATASGRVVEARVEDDGAQLVLENGATMRLADVTRLTE